MYGLLIILKLRTLPTECLCVSYGSHNKLRLFPWTGRSLLRRRNVFPVRYEMDCYILFRSISLLFRRVDCGGEGQQQFTRRTDQSLKVKVVPQFRWILFPWRLSLYFHYVTQLIARIIDNLTTILKKFILFHCERLIHGQCSVRLITLFTRVIPASTNHRFWERNIQIFHRII
jgi:hypothetical protein